jgi:hypothetical protein
MIYAGNILCTCAVEERPLCCWTVAAWQTSGGEVIGVQSVTQNEDTLALFHEFEEDVGLLGFQI